LKTKEKLASYGVTLVQFDKSCFPPSENAENNPQRRTVQPGDAFEDTAFKPGFEIVKS
jgi:hypothetical protein